MSRSSARWAALILASVITAGCGGGGDSASPASTPSTVTAAPVVDLVSPVATVAPRTSVQLSWTSTNSTSCTATGAWTGARATSGTANVVVADAGTYGLECAGAGGTASDSVAIAVAATYSLTVQVRYEAPGPPILAPMGGNRVPDWEHPVVAPVPHVYVELIDVALNRSVVASTYADAAGNAVFSGLSPSRDYLPRVLSKILTTSPTLDFMVVNNTAGPVATSASRFRDRYRPYELTPATPYNAGGSTDPQVTTVTAPTGWDGSTLVDADRAGGLFGLLANAVKEARSFAAATNSANWRSLTILWSTQNAGGLTGAARNFDEGKIDGSGGYYSSGHGVLNASGEEQTTGTVFEDFIFLSGAQDFELHELYPFVSNHEMGHFVQAQFSRLVGPAGPHRNTDYSDFRLAYIEGTANAIALLVAESPIVVRSVPFNGQVVALVDDWSAGRPSWPVGWFQETTVAKIFWKLYDPALTGSPHLSRDIVLAPMVDSSFRTGVFLPSIWAHVTLLKSLNPAAAPAIDSVVTAQGVVAANNDVWGTRETNAGNRTQSRDALPPYIDIAVGQTLTAASGKVCSAGAPKEYNKVGNRRLLRLPAQSTTAQRTITVTGPGGTNPVLTTYNTSACGGRECNEIDVNKTVSESATFSYAGTTLVEIGDCAVAHSETSSDVTACANPAPPAEQCWTVTLQ